MGLRPFLLYAAGHYVCSISASSDLASSNHATTKRGRRQGAVPSGEEAGDDGVELAEPEAERGHAEHAGSQKGRVVGISEEGHGEGPPRLLEPVQEPPVGRGEGGGEEEGEGHVRASRERRRPLAAGG